MYQSTNKFTEAIAIECGIITNPASDVHSASMLSRNPVESKLIIPSGSEKDVIMTEERPTRSITLSGPELITLNDNQWNQLCDFEEIVFARTTPEQKLRIVKGKYRFLATKTELTYIIRIPKA